MLEKHKKIASLVTFCLILALISLYKNQPSQAISLFQSGLPKPENPHFVFSSKGGQISCGLQQSYVWIQVPLGFTPEGGAEFHCDPADSLIEFTGVTSAWNNQGYLIGFWPSETPINKPFSLVFEIDPVRVNSTDQNYFIAKYYDNTCECWKSISTWYDPTKSRVYATISGFLPPSGYPGYADRFLIVLFENNKNSSLQPSPTSSTNPFPTPEVTATSTIISKLQPTIPSIHTIAVSIDTPTFTLIATKTTPTSTPTSTITKTTSIPSLQSAPTATLASNTSHKTSQPYYYPEAKNFIIIIVILTIIIIILVGTVMFMIGKYTGNKNGN